MNATSARPLGAEPQMSLRGQAPPHDSGTIPLAFFAHAEEPRLLAILTRFESQPQSRLGGGASLLGGRAGLLGRSASLLGGGASLLGRGASLNSGEDVLFKAVCETDGGLHCELGHEFVTGSGRFQEEMGSEDGSRVSIPTEDARSS